jgi:arsenate reductase
MASEVSERQLPGVLFVCVGNSCRSQLAEAFGRKLGRGIFRAYSAGLEPAGVLSSGIRQVAPEFGLDFEGQYSKGFGDVPLDAVDLVVNLSGRPAAEVLARLRRIDPSRAWEALLRDHYVEDPGGGDLEAYREAARRIRDVVQAVITEVQPGLQR